MAEARNFLSIFSEYLLSSCKVSITLYQEKRKAVEQIDCK